MLNEIKADVTLERRQSTCSGPIFMITDKMKELKTGQILKVDTDEPATGEEINDMDRAAGRAGGGAVMGSKNVNVSFAVEPDPLKAVDLIAEHIERNRLDLGI